MVDKNLIQWSRPKSATTATAGPRLSAVALFGEMPPLLMKDVRRHFHPLADDKFCLTLAVSFLCLGGHHSTSFVLFLGGGDALRYRNPLTAHVLAL